jgi:hypothetical protein
VEEVIVVQNVLLLPNWREWKNWPSVLVGDVMVVRNIHLLPNWRE